MKKKLLWILILGLIIISCKQRKTEMKEKIIKTNGIELCTESFGNKKNPAILLVAGATVSMLYWDTEFCQQLSEKGFFVIRYDKDRKSTRLNSSHVRISYAVFCLKKKKKKKTIDMIK